MSTFIAVIGGWLIMGLFIFLLYTIVEIIPNYIYRLMTNVKRIKDIKDIDHE